VKFIIRLLAASSVAMALFACASIPKGAVAVEQFQKERYLGKWYEIARFDFAFEKDLNNTTAEYSPGKDGSIVVVNRGFNVIKNKWQEARGKARFRSADTKAELEVSFFGPFYGAYNVIALDAEYRYALVAGSDLRFLWILSRSKTIPEDVKAEYVDLARSLGYDVPKLVWVEQDIENPGNP
jgi:apolipoprotein D and lipocalin family protein